jgi:cytochrome c551/c552
MRAIVCAALCIAFSGVHASDKLADKHGCDNCHAADKKMVGPSLKAIADKYRDTPDAATMLVGKVQGGSTGTWGPVAMPAMAHVPVEDTRALVSWILKR